MYAIARPKQTIEPQARSSKSIPAGWLFASVFFIFGVYNFVLTIIGIAKNYSPIPYADDWIGSVGFMHEIADHRFSSWIEKFNEHRIITQRIVTWFDYKIFGGRDIFEIVLIAISYFAMPFLLTNYEYKYRSKIDYIVDISIVICLMLSWVQYHNFTLGFQFQFVAAYFFAVLSFLAYSRLSFMSYSVFPLVSATVFGLCSAASMANGVFALPTLALQALLLKDRKRNFVFFAVLSAVISAAYFHEGIFSRIGKMSVPIASPPSIFMFLLRLLGGPLFAPLGSDPFCIFMGFLSICIMLALLVIAFVNFKAMTPARSFYVSVCIFCFVSAMTIAIGRSLAMVIFGTIVAYSSRYLIVPLLFWCSLFLLALDLSGAATKRRMIVAAIAPIALFLSIYQWHAADDGVGLFDRKLGVLSYKIGLGRKELVPLAFVGSARFIAEATWAATNRVGVYGSLPWLRDAGVVQYDRAQENDSMCYGVLEMRNPDPRGDRVSGWAVAPSRSTNLMVLLVDRQGRTAGYGIIGAKRPDLQTRGLPLESGWVGFAKPGSGPLTAYLYLNDRPCRLSGQVQ